MNPDQKIAYFSMEIGLESRLPTYSGGLGVLAGDTIRSAADLKAPLVAVCLLCPRIGRATFASSLFNRRVNLKWD